MPELSSYASVHTFIRGRFRPLGGADDPACAPTGTLTSGPTREEFLASSHLPDVVNRFFCQMDMKLDAILAGMQSGKLECDFPHDMTVSSISASELLFTSETPVAPGDWLEIVLFLGQSGLFAASGIGQVKDMARERSGNVFSFSFSRLAEGEREKIIRFVFSEERKALREKRLD